MTTHSSVLAWRIPGMGEPGGLPSMGSHRVRHNWSDLAAAAAAAAGYLGPDRTGFCLRSDHQLLSVWSSGSQILITTPRLGKAEVIKGQLSLSVSFSVCVCVCLCVCMCACMLSCSVVSNSLWPYGLWLAWHLCPWDSSGKNTRLGCHFLLQGIFLT